jgi:hypothetical protein
MDLRSRTPTPLRPAAAAACTRCRRKFLRFFPGGFRDETYVAWERGYKWSAHERWERELGAPRFRRLLRAGEFEKIAKLAVSIESRTNLLFSFEKMAIRDAIRTPAGAEGFARALFQLLHGRASLAVRFDRWCDALEALPQRGKRIRTWPVVTVFGFLARPDVHFFVKPTVTRRAAEALGRELWYESRPTSAAYFEFLGFAESVRREIADLRPKDQIDVQSYVWVQGSDEYD